MTEPHDKCNVYIFGTEIEEGKAGKALSAVAPSVMCLQHWAVVLRYEDGNVAVCEANPDKKGILAGQMSWKTATYVDSLDANKVFLGQYKLPVERVVKVMRKMNRETTYVIYKNNCQSWVKELLKRLKIPAPVTAFAETHVGQQINRVADYIEGGSHSEEETTATHSTQTVSQKPSAPRGRQPQTGGGRRSRRPSQEQGGHAARLAPIAWVGATAAGAVAAAALVWNRLRTRRTPR